MYRATCVNCKRVFFPIPAPALVATCTKPGFADCVFEYAEQDGAPLNTNPHLGLGDRIESALSSIGITQQSWGAFREKFGLPPECNCSERVELINDGEQWMRQAAAELGTAATAAISKIWAPISWLKNREKDPVQSGISPALPPTMETRSNQDGRI